MEGRCYVCNSDHRAAGQAHGLPWPQGAGKGVRGHNDEYQTQDHQNARALPDESGAGGAAVRGAFLCDRQYAVHLPE